MPCIQKTSISIRARTIVLTHFSKTTVFLIWTQTADLGKLKCTRGIKTTSYFHPIKIYTTSFSCVSVSATQLESLMYLTLLYCRWLNGNLRSYIQICCNFYQNMSTTLWTRFAVYNLLPKFLKYRLGKKMLIYIGPVSIIGTWPDQSN